MRRPLLLLALLSACSTPAEKNRKAMEALCPRVETMVCDETIVNVNPADRATIIASRLSDLDPAYATLFAGIAPIPVKDKLPWMTSTVSKALGHPWSCPAWEATWQGRDACAEQKGK